MIAYNFGGSGRNLTKLYQGTWLETGVIKWKLILQGGWQKNPKFSAIFDNFRLWSRISPERINISKIGKVLDQLHFIPYWTKKFGELWCNNQKVIDAHVHQPNWTFLGDYISALRGAGPSNFNTLKPLKYIASRTWGAGRPQVGLCPIFLVIMSILAFHYWLIRHFHSLQFDASNSSRSWAQSVSVGGWCSRCLSTWLSRGTTSQLLCDTCCYHMLSPIRDDTATVSTTTCVSSPSTHSWSTSTSYTRSAVAYCCLHAASDFHT